MLKSERLRHIARYIRKQAPMADIGTDHALLPCYLVQNEIVPGAIAVEVNCGPYEAARRYVAACRLSERIDVRLRDGLTGLRPGEVDTIVIAGMGGKLITRILSDGLHVVAATKRLVLQPNVAANKLRRWMLDHGWQLIAEDLVSEQQHFYDILVAEPGVPHIPYEVAADTFSIERLVEVGPLLWQQKHPLLRARLEKDVTKWEGILQQLKTSQLHDSEKKRAHIKQQLRDWKEMIACLPRESTSSAFLKGGFPRT